MHVRLALIASALALVACSESTPRREVTAPSENVAGPWIPAGTELVIRMNESLGPAMSPAREPFTAQLVTPLITKNGIVVAPPGSLVHGHVVGTDRASERIEIAFDRVQTPDGAFYPFQATIVAANPWALTVRGPQPQGPASTVVLQARGPMPMVGGGPGATGGGPATEEDETTAPGPGVVLPFGAQVRVTLTRPISYRR